MSRDLVLAALALGLGGGVTWLAGLVGTPDARAVSSGTLLERAGWRRLWLPFVPAAVALATLAGWALQEPQQTDELLRPWVAALVLPVGVVWLRAALRAGLALRRPRTPPPFATVGLWRPRVQVGPGAAERLDPAAAAAAIAHERAHARHRDPLRIWLAQIATDVQWPIPAARHRLRRWTNALEIARDEEARRDGVAGEDLAAAIVAVASMGDRRRTAPQGATALTGAGAGADLAARVRRLLAPLPPEPARAPLLGPALLLASLALATIVGLEFGDSLLRALPFVTT